MKAPMIAESALERALEELKPLCESITETPEGIVIRPKQLLKELSSRTFLHLYEQIKHALGGKYHPYEYVFIIPKASQRETTSFSAAAGAPARSDKHGLSPDCDSQDETVKPDLQQRTVEGELAKLRAHFGRKLSKREVMESLCFLVHEGLRAEEIAVKIAVSRATVYRHLPAHLKSKAQPETEP
jgi:hypothetical protein